ncbi:MAG: TIGR03620 family F420-dependent LLM class oxidoreductase, partial [Nocardiopsaceae bacterium]|nr:TIGR03620 family F420-dependent LLM class oxidoreductase [Nocardiopsaceae bacterium]
MTTALARVGIWSTHYGADRSELGEVVAELEELGYGALWYPNRPDAFDLAAALLDATHEMVAASGVISIWDRPAGEVARAFGSLNRVHPDRFLLGLGVSHAELVDREQPGRYTRPLTRMREYLEELDTALDSLPAAGRVLGALGPRMLELARDRTAGAHPYLGTVEHTRRARELLGPGPLLAPELTVVLESDACRARSIAREQLTFAARWGFPTYFEQRNYTSNWRRLGFVDDDFVGGGSDRLIDAVVAWGDPPAIRERIHQHFAAGADHVCLQVATG